MPNPATFKGLVGPLIHRCQKCKVTGEELPRCGGCRAVRYCSVEHQVADRQNHKSACNGIKKARSELAKEDDLVRNATPNFATPANAFETDVGRFWGISSTRDYMGARFRLAVTHLVQIATLDGTSEALEHMKDMMRLCHGDNMGIRDIITHTMLRLDLDQECYDFIKGLATASADDENPLISVESTNILESPEFLLDEYPQLAPVVAVLLLKLKLLVDVIEVKKTRKVLSRTALPVEVQNEIEMKVARSPLSAHLYKESYQSLLHREKKLLNHVCQLGACAVKANKNFMFELFEPDDALAAEPNSYIDGSWEETALVLQNCYATWWETEGVLDLLADARACAARDSETEIEDMMESEKCVHGGSPRTAKEVLSDISVNRVWGYLDWAVDNASYLGPLSERPSERHTKTNQEAWDRAQADEEFDTMLEDGKFSIAELEAMIEDGKLRIAELEAMRESRGVSDER